MSERIERKLFVSNFSSNAETRQKPENTAAKQSETEPIVVEELRSLLQKRQREAFEWAQKLAQLPSPPTFPCERALQNEFAARFEAEFEAERQTAELRLAELRAEVGRLRIARGELETNAKLADARLKRKWKVVESEIRENHYNRLRAAAKATEKSVLDCGVDAVKAMAKRRETEIEKLKFEIAECERRIGERKNDQNLRLKAPQKTIIENTKKVFLCESDIIKSNSSNYRENSEMFLKENYAKSQFPNRIQQFIAEKLRAHSISEETLTNSIAY